MQDNRPPVNPSPGRVPQKADSSPWVPVVGVLGFLAEVLTFILLMVKL
jgi:hypothetical protein